MGAALPKKPFKTMRIPIFRSLLAAIFLLVLLVVLFKQDTSSFSTRLLHSSFQKPTVVHGQHRQNNHPAQIPGFGNGKYDMDCKADAAHLQKIRDKYRLADKFQYMKRFVRFNRTEGLERKRMTHVQQKLLPDGATFKTIQLNNNEVDNDNVCYEPIDVPVPASGLPSTANASDFTFGVSTTYKRFMDSSKSPIKEWIFWLTDSHGNSNGGKLLLMLLDATDEQLQEVASLLGDVGIDADVYHSDSRLEMAVRYLTLVPTLYMHPDTPKKKWLVTCDDDTFFPNMHSLIDQFNKFDHDREMYVGTLSEDSGAVERHGSQAFGGGGVFLSVPMAKKITELYDSCTTPAKIREADSGWGPQGDIILRKCIYENTETRLTTVWALWQLDILGHPSGFYEWGIKPLSLHHYRGGGWHEARPSQVAKLALTCGEDCSFMRFQFEDDFIISGYSIAHYPYGVTFDTDQMEGTAHAAPQDKGYNLDYKFGPQRPSLLKTGRKIAWELQESEVRSDGSILQTYTRQKDDERWVTSNGRAMSNIDGVIELVWIPA